MNIMNDGERRGPETDRLHEKFGISSATAVTHVAAVRAGLDLAAAELLPGQVAAHSTGAPGRARHGGGEVDGLLHVGAVRPQTEVFRVYGILGSGSRSDQGLLSTLK